VRAEKLNSPWSVGIPCTWAFCFEYLFASRHRPKEAHAEGRPA
jgi:hypothetical protein